METVHFFDMQLINATNPVTVNLIGAGGTGSVVLWKLGAMNQSMLALGHPGLSVRLWDDDLVSEANLGRQNFASSQVGLYKSVALINNINRWEGTNWKAETTRYCGTAGNASASIVISCVDNVATRFEIAKSLKGLERRYIYRDCPRYWMDFGNSKQIGQVVLSSVGDIKQPQSDRYITRENLPFVTDEFGELLKRSEEVDDTPSCSLAEALERQDLYINSTLAHLGCSLLWKMFRYGMARERGVFLNLDTFSTKSLKVG